MRQVNPPAMRDDRWLARRDARLLLYIVLGIVAPFALWGLLFQPRIDAAHVANPLWAALFANIASYYTLEQLRKYAKTQQLSYVMPVNAVTFAIAFVAVGIARIDFSNSLFLLLFLSTIAISYVLSARTRQTERIMYIAPGGRVNELPERPNFVPASSFEELQLIINNSAQNLAVVGDLHFDHTPEWERLFASAALKGIPVYHYRQILELQTGQVRITHLSENELGSLIPNLPYMAAKRAFDVLAVLFLLPVLLPIMALIAILIRLDSPGNVLFVQERMGYGKQPFRMIKFRTMRERQALDDTTARRDDAMTKDDDDRITRIGRFLRKSRLDELPQAWNILRGEMSWIGPRPEAIDLSDWYEGEIPFYSYRHIVRPGITGWAQVNQGHVTDLNAVNHKLRFDFYYVKNVSLWLDILIALKTVRVILGGFGAR